MLCVATTNPFILYLAFNRHAHAVPLARTVFNLMFFDVQQRGGLKNPYKDGYSQKLAV